MFFCEYLKMSNEEETGGTEDVDLGNKYEDR